MVIYKKLNKTYLVALFFLIISTLLIFAWFKDGHFYGGGDVGLPTYNPIRMFQIAKFIWWEAIAPGFLIPHVITSITLYSFLSIFQFFGIGPFGIQAILFLIILFLMGFGTYLLTLSIIGQDKKKFATFAGLFYIFNPYMLTQIWHRFVHTSFLFVASIPFLILFWRLWIKSGNYLYLLYFLLVSFFASYMFGTIAYVFPFWLIMSLFSISEIFLPWENKSHLIKILWRSALGSAFWILLNSWWIIPVATVSQGIASQQHNIWESIETLIVISKQAILPYSLQLGNSFYLFDQTELGEIYKSFFFRIIPWLGVIVIFYGMVYSLKKKYLAPYVLIYLVIIMLAKGTSPPFGQPFLLLFSKSFAFGLLRNPFEKIGILLPLVSSILFALGIEGFFNWPNKILSKTGKKIILIIWLMIMGIYYWPMYQGTIFGSIGKPNYVEIPKSYGESDQWFKQKDRQDSIADGKILHLPLTRSDIATYNWKYGYHGVESSASLFTVLPSISHGLNLHRIDDALTALSLMFHEPYSSQHEKILKLLQDFNVRFIILHQDMEWRGVDVYDPTETQKILDTLIFLKREVQFGDLVIYEVLPQYFQPKVILTDKINFAYPEKAVMRMWPVIVSKYPNNIITPLDTNTDKIFSKSDEVMVFPQLSFTYLDASERGLDSVINNLAVLLYNLSNTKTMINKNGDVDAERLAGKIIIAGEDLINSYILLKDNSFLQVDSLIKRYSQTINELFEQDLRKSKLSFSVSPTTIDDIFKLHLLILEQMDMKLNPHQKEVINLAKNKIKQDLNNYKLLPIYSLVNKDNLTIQERQINQFSIPVEGKYELLMVNSSVSDIYQKKLDGLDFQINDQLSNFKATILGDLISYGEREFNKGEYEISFNNLISTNLISLERLTKSDNVTVIDKDTIQLNSDGQTTSYIEGDLGSVSGEDTYQIVFDGSFLTGIEFYVQIIQDNDQVIDGKQRPRVGTFIYRTRQDSNFQNYGFKLSSLNVATRKAKFRIIVDPIGADSFYTPNSFGSSTSVVIKNLKISRILNNQIFLRSKMGKEVTASISGQINQMEQKSPVLYEGRIKVDHPTFLIFKEAFHPGWELELKRDNEVYKVDQHYLANLYSNSWWIEKTGAYEFKIEFKPQQKVTQGAYLALAGLLGVSFLLVRSKMKKNL